MIKKLSIISVFGIFSFSALHKLLYMLIKDFNGKPVESAEVDLKLHQNDVTADKIGYFSIC